MRWANEELRREIGLTTNRLSEVGRQIQELNIACNEIDQKIAASERDGLSALLGAAASLAATFVVAKLLPGANIYFKFRI